MTLQHFKNLQEKNQPQVVDFEYSVGYIAQATRNGLYIATSDETAVVFTHRDDDPHSKYVIVVSSGLQRAELIRNIAPQLASSSQKDVIVKNVGADLESRLLQRGFEQYLPEEQWDNYARYDDNTFPQQVIDSEEYCGLRGSKYASLREELRRFERQYSLSLRPYETKDDISMLVRKWASQMKERNGVNEDELLRSHQMFLDHNSDYVQYVVEDNKSGQIIGYMSFSKISDNTLGFNVLINDFSYRNLYRVMMDKGIEIAHDQGFRYINLQGSEDEAQYRSKRRFKAEIEIPKKHLVYRY